jgi:hypothetical protein
VASVCVWGDLDLKGTVIGLNVIGGEIGAENFSVGVWIKAKQLSLPL